MLIASFGAALGAAVLFLVGGARMVGAAQSIFAGNDPKLAIASVMAGTDAFLFGKVLVIFAYAVAFGFVFDLSSEARLACRHGCV